DERAARGSGARSGPGLEEAAGGRSAVDRNETVGRRDETGAQPRFRIAGARRADDEHVVARLRRGRREARRGTEARGYRGGVRSVGDDAEQREIGGRVAADDARAEHLAVGGRDVDLL